MSIQTYHCDHCNADFVKSVPVNEDVPKSALCPKGHPSSWKPPTGVHFTVEGGTGAAKGGRDR